MGEAKRVCEVCGRGLSARYAPAQARCNECETLPLGMRLTLMLERRKAEAEETIARELRYIRNTLQLGRGKKEEESDDEEE